LKKYDDEEAKKVEEDNKKKAEDAKKKVEDEGNCSTIFTAAQEEISHVRY
jgi:hypothetical protein